MSATIYVPGTEITDPKQIIMSLQAIGAYLTKGNFAFPATQNLSIDPNNLDDYEEGNWTPVLTFATPGDLSVTYSAIRTGYYTKIGRLVSIQFAILTSAFTYTTAAGNLLVTGLPFTSVNDTNYRSYAPMTFNGINKATYTTVMGAIAGNSTQLEFLACGMGVAVSNVVAADVPTAGTVVIGGGMAYVV